MFTRSGLAVLMLMASPAAAQEKSASTPGFSVKGDGSWEMICHVVRNGEQQTLVMNARKGDLFDARLARAECASSRPAQGELTISVVGAAKCPFKDGTEQACSTSVPKGRPVSFAFKANAQR